jgi:hypothetical protein
MLASLYGSYTIQTDIYNFQTFIIFNNRRMVIFAYNNQIGITFVYQITFVYASH